MAVWGQLLLAPPKAVPSMGDLLMVFAPRCLFCKAGKSQQCQTPVGTERLELLGLGRRKADYLCWNLMGVKSPPPRKPAVGFLETKEVMNCVFSCLIRKSKLSECLGCAVPF